MANSETDGRTKKGGPQRRRGDVLLYLLLRQWEETVDGGGGGGGGGRIRGLHTLYIIIYIKYYRYTYYYCYYYNIGCCSRRYNTVDFSRGQKKNTTWPQHIRFVFCRASRLSNGRDEEKKLFLIFRPRSSAPAAENLANAIPPAAGRKRVNRKSEQFFFFFFFSCPAIL